MSVPEFVYQESGFVAYRLLRGRPLYRHELALLTDEQQLRLADQPALIVWREVQAGSGR
jgi:hypothetical protein